MNLQKHFSPKRFYKCLKYDLVLNGKIYLFSIIGLMVVLMIINLINLNSFNNFYSNNFNRNNFNIDFENYFFRSYYAPLFIFFIIFGTILSAGTSFPALRSSNNSINYLLLPASTLEKFLVQFFIRILAFVLLFIPIYWLIFKFSYNFYGLFGTVLESVKSYSLLSPFQGEIEGIDFYLIIVSVIISSLFAFVGATYFKKYALFKSIFTFALTAVFLFLLMVLLSHLFFDHTTKEFFEIKLRSYSVYENIKNLQLYFAVLFTATSLILFMLAYFKLKEREI